jgi:hypothetical protein
MGKFGITNCTRINKLIMNGSEVDDLDRNDEKYEYEKRKLTTLEKICSKYGFEPIFFNISEFYKSGAAVSCMIMHLNYVDYMSDKP